MMQCHRHQQGWRPISYDCRLNDALDYRRSSENEQDGGHK